MQENFYFITVATKPHHVLDILLKTVESKNESIEVLGLIENRDIGQDLPNGSRRLGVKLNEIYKFIHRENINNNDIILFSDAYDVCYTGDKTTIIERFNKISKPILFGAEACCYPDGSKASIYPKTTSFFKYLNSGLFIGRVWALRQCMQNYQYDDDINDQLWWTNKFLENQHLIELDYNNSIFLNCVWMKDDNIKYNEDKVILYNDRTPQLVHGNGPSKKFIEPLLDFAKIKFNL